MGGQTVPCAWCWFENTLVRTYKLVSSWLANLSYSMRSSYLAEACCPLPCPQFLMPPWALSYQATILKDHALHQLHLCLSPYLQHHLLWMTLVQGCLYMKTYAVMCIALWTTIVCVVVRSPIVSLDVLNKDYIIMVCVCVCDELWHCVYMYIHIVGQWNIYMYKRRPLLGLCYTWLEMVVTHIYTICRRTRLNYICTFSLSSSVAVLQSLSFLILVTRGKRIEMPAAVWLLELLNSAPVISHTGAFCVHVYMYVCVRLNVTYIHVHVYLWITNDKVGNEGLIHQQPTWYLGSILYNTHKKQTNKQTNKQINKQQQISKPHHFILPCWSWPYPVPSEVGQWLHRHDHFHI